MKKLIAIALGAILAVTTIGAQPAQATGCGMSGAGTQVSPWLITNAADFAQVEVGAGCSTTHSANQYFRLNNDVALSAPHTPFSFYAGSGYVADFDGNGHKISGLNVAMSGTSTVGLFTSISEANIHDLEITGSSISGQTWVGALAGQAAYSTISRVKVNLTGDVSGGQSVGGVVGSMSATNMSDVTFSTTGVVRGTSYCGGAVGSVTDGSINRVSVKANISFSNIGGGVVGEYIPSSNATVDQLFYSGTMVADQYSAGLIGYLWAYGGPITVAISNSAVRGSVGTVSSLYQPYAFVGQANTSMGPNASNISSVTYSNSYSTAQYKSAGNTATAVGLEGGLTEQASGIYFEPNSGSGLDTVRAASISAITSIPAGWSGVVETSGAAVSNTNKWVVDNSVGSPRNDGRPMPVGAYNLGFFERPCAAGTYSSNGMTPNCAPARSGHYVANPGQTSDVECPAGSFQANSGSINCVLASVGSYVPTPGASASTPCQNGYESAQGATVCTRIAVIAAPAVIVPTLTAPAVAVTPGQKVTLQGKNVELIKGLTLSDRSLEFSVTVDAITFTVPSEASLGVKDLIIGSNSGTVIIQEALVVVETAIVKPVSAQKVILKRIGSKLTVYVTSLTPVSIVVSGKIVAKNISGTAVKTSLLLPKGKSVVLVKSPGKLLRKAVFAFKK